MDRGVRLRFGQGWGWTDRAVDRGLGRGGGGQTER